MILIYNTVVPKLGSPDHWESTRVPGGGGGGVLSTMKELNIFKLTDRGSF